MPAWLVIGVLALILATRASAGFVYETTTEFLSSGDFNGDGIIDVLVLDKATGNARVGYQNAAGALLWSSPLPTGVAHAGSLAVGRFIQTNREAIAVTSAEFNRIHVLDLANPSNAPAPVVVNPPHAGVAMLVGLEDPYGTGAAAAHEPGWLAAGTHDPGITLLDLLAYSLGGAASFQDQIVTEGFLNSGNSFRRSIGEPTLLAAMRRGSNDTFLAFAYTNTAAPLLSRPGLPSGSEYVFGHFDNATDTRFLFYVPGESNITVQRLIASPSGLAFGPPTLTAFTGAVQRVYYIDEGATGSGVVQFGDGAVGVRPPTGSDQLHITAGLGLGPAGNVITGVAPIGLGKFALLWGNSNTFITAESRVFTQSGSNYVQTSSSTLPPTTSAGTRANVWLFSGEPFVNSEPGFIASLSSGNWVTTLNGLPGTLAVRVESDRGLVAGLGNATTNVLGPPPGGSVYGLPNQYHPAISLFSYAAPRAAEPSRVTISPLPGNYPGPILVSISKADANDSAFYRLEPSSAWTEYLTPFAVTNDVNVAYYGQTLAGDRATVRFASYTIAGGTKPPLLDTDPTGTNSPSGGTNGSTGFQLSLNGTVFYGRQSGTTGSVWAINLDGTSDQFITTGTRPRVSPDGRFLAFLREGNPFNSQGNLWVRDLATGQETRLFTNPDYLVFYAWDAVTTNLFFDYSCGLWRTDLAGNVAALPMANDCNDDAPALNPVDGRLAFHNLNPNTAIRGLYVAPPDATTKQRLTLAAANPRWSAWSPDGQWLAFADGTSISLEDGRNLWVVKPDGTEPHQITGFTDANGFRHGALWSPGNDALVGAGSIGGVNGIWVLPLSEDYSTCIGTPRLLPTTPGDAIDFVGSVLAPPRPPDLSIRRDTGAVIVFWRTSAVHFVLEVTAELVPGAVWTPILGPYPSVGNYFEVTMPEASLAAGAFFRLRHP